MQRHGELHRAETGPEVSAGLGDDFDEVLAHVVAQTLEFGDRELPEVRRDIHPVKVRICWLTAHSCSSSINVSFPSRSLFSLFSVVSARVSRLGTRLRKLDPFLVQAQRVLQWNIPLLQLVHYFLQPVQRFFERSLSCRGLFRCHGQISVMVERTLPSVNSISMPSRTCRSDPHAGDHTVLPHDRISPLQDKPRIEREQTLSQPFQPCSGEFIAVGEGRGHRAGQFIQVLAVPAEEIHRPVECIALQELLDMPPLER